MTQDTNTPTPQLEIVPNGNPGAASAEPTTSSAPAEPVKKRPRMPKTVQWMDMPPPYEGMRIRVWVNFPNGLTQDIQSGDKEKIQNAVRQIFIEHNDWEDFDGNPLPQTDDQKFWDFIPNELASTMVAMLDIEGNKLPNLVRQNAQR